MFSAPHCEACYYGLPLSTGSHTCAASQAQPMLPLTAQLSCQTILPTSKCVICGFNFVSLIPNMINMRCDTCWSQMQSMALYQQSFYPASNQTIVPQLVSLPSMAMAALLPEPWFSGGVPQAAARVPSLSGPQFSTVVGTAAPGHQKISMPLLPPPSSAAASSNSQTPISVSNGLSSAFQPPASTASHSPLPAVTSTSLNRGASAISAASTASAIAPQPVAVADAAARAASPVVTLSPAAAGATSMAFSQRANQRLLLSEEKCGICSKVMLPGNLCEWIGSSHAITQSGYYYICMECAKTCPTCLQPRPRARYIELNFLAPSFYKVCAPCGTSYNPTKSIDSMTQIGLRWLVNRLSLLNKLGAGNDKRFYLLEKKIVSSEPCVACAQEQRGPLRRPLAIHSCPERAWQKASNHHQPLALLQQPPSSNAGDASSGASSFPAVASAAARAASPVAALSPTAASAASAASSQIVNQPPFPLSEEKCQVCYKDMRANQNTQWQWGGVIEINFINPPVWKVCNVCKLDFIECNKSSKFTISSATIWTEWVNRRKRFVVKTARLRLPWNPTGLKCEGCLIDIPPCEMRKVPPSELGLYRTGNAYKLDSFDSLPYRLCQACSKNWRSFRDNTPELCQTQITQEVFLLWLHDRNISFQFFHRIPNRTCKFPKKQKPDSE